MDHCRDSLSTYARPPLILYHPRPVLLNLPFTRPGPPFKLRLVRTHGFGNTSGKKMSVASRLILNWLIKTSIIVPHNHRPISYCFCHIHPLGSWASFDGDKPTTKLFTKKRKPCSWKCIFSYLRWMVCLSVSNKHFELVGFFMQKNIWI